MAKISIFCFAASYGVALALEIYQLLASRPWLRLVTLLFGSAGLLAQTLFIAQPLYINDAQPLSLASPVGSLLFLAWILAVFYLYGSIHHGRISWGLFVLPVVLGLITLAEILPQGQTQPPGILRELSQFSGDRIWGIIHGCLLLFGAVGVSVAAVASVMYLVQVRRLRTKAAPDQGVKMLSLERIEAMNRRAILWAFPLITVGLLVGLFRQSDFLHEWGNPKILSVLGLWLVFAILLYLRYAVRARGRQVALWTLLAFAVMVMALVSGHPSLGPSSLPDDGEMRGGK